MAELVIYTQDIGTYENGDIIQACNDRRISSVHCQHICHIKDNPLNGDGLNEYGLSQIFEEACCQYKHERLSEKVARRTDLTTGISEESSKIPDLQSRIQHERHRIYGFQGREIWYSGRFNDSIENLNAVWAEIEQRTAYRKADFFYSPLTDAELTAFLAISVDDFANDARLDAPKTEIQGDEEIIIKKRANKVDWKPLFSIGDILDIENKHTKVDIRDQTTYLVDNIVQVKP